MPEFDVIITRCVYQEARVRVEAASAEEAEEEAQMDVNSLYFTEVDKEILDVEVEPG